ncbi:MAG TPA: multicopper oxidase domain-containing protein [Bradyrhizobium sp.]|nr:multicopper oxidase domain-containing protein [Bradyrhizobium sp.]
MNQGVFPLSRRELLTGVGATLWVPASAIAQAGRRLTLRAAPGEAALRPGHPDTPIWSLMAQTPNADLRFRRGDQVEIAFRNDLPVSTVLNWYGLDEIAAAQALTARQPLAPGATENFGISFRKAGTFLCDLRLLGDGQAYPSPARALIVAETEPVAVDRDEAILIEDWRIRSDGSTIAPGTEPFGASTIFTANGQASVDIATRRHQRLRFRFINGCQRTGIAVKIEEHDLRVMAIDSRPSEPFPARNGQLVLAPGTRIDAFLDATRPPGSTAEIMLHDGKEARPIGRLVYSAESPARDAPLPVPPPLPEDRPFAPIDLRNATRLDLTLGGPSPEWTAPAGFSGASAPAFRARTGRTVVLALTNRAQVPTVFHLHGHHFRLLDRLDDGWKPFWLDTLAIDAGATQRIAFAAEHVGRWLIDSFATTWSAPRLVRWYSVE